MKRNNQIREVLKIEERNENINKYRGSWKEHMSRMASDKFPKIALLYQPIRKRSLGWPRKRCSDQFGDGTG